jgi:hypothetical protein
MYQFGILDKTTTEFKIATINEVSNLLEIKARLEVENFLTKKNSRYKDCINKALNILIDRLLNNNIVECGNCTIIRFNDGCASSDRELNEEIKKFLLTV